MFNILFKYFSLYKKLNLPGIGSFEIKQEHAFFHAGDNLLNPPVQNIIFIANQGVADKKLFQFIAAANNIDEVEAIRLVHNFAYELKENVKASDYVELPFLGILKSTSGGYTLEGSATLPYYPGIEVKEVLREEVNQPGVVVEEDKVIVTESFDEEQSIAKDWWWIYAIVLGVIGVAAILYYYINLNH